MTTSSSEGNLPNPCPPLRWCPPASSIGIVSCCKRPKQRLRPRPPAGTLPATSAGSAGSSGGRASPAPHNDVILVSKVLTYSDVSVEVARTGRIVLPRIQVGAAHRRSEVQLGQHRAGRLPPGPEGACTLACAGTNWPRLHVSIPLQVQQCLPELLQLCQAGHALPAVRSGGPVKLSVDLEIVDEAGRTWVLLLKTWQNVVSGEHRPTFVLENTGSLGRVHGLG